MRHQEGQVHAAGQGGRAEEQHEDAAAAEPAAQAGPQAESPEEGEDEQPPSASLHSDVFSLWSPLAADLRQTFS